MQKDFILEAQDEKGFSFTFMIEKAEAVDTGLDEMILSGVASTTNIDHDNERMSAESLKSMANVINTTGVPLRYEHQKNENAVIGTVFKASVDERNQLKIETRLNKDHPAAPLLYKALKEGSKYGFSVGGRVKRAIKEFSEKTGKMVKTFYDVLLDEVSVTQRPANYDAWLVAKSIVDKGSDIKEFYKSDFYREFLFENPQLDYMRAFAKSIPDKSWKKINSNKENTMRKAEEKKDEEMKDTEKSFVTVKSFNELQSLVSKGFNSITSLLAKMTEPAKDEENPDKDKEKDPGDGTSKSREGQEDSKGNGDDEKGERESKSIDDEEKKDEEKEKSMDDKEDEDKEKSMDDEKDEEKKEKSADDEKKDEEESTKSISSAISRIQKLNKAMSFKKSEGEEEVKDEEVKDEEEKTDEGEEVIKTKKTASIDAFVAVVADALENFKERYEKSNKNVVGLDRAFVDAIRNDKEVQKEIMSMLKEPGFKKSVSMGVPIMRTKDGRSYELTAKALGTIEKSQKGEGEKSFKDAWKSDFSSLDKSN